MSPYNIAIDLVTIGLVVSACYVGFGFVKKAQNVNGLIQKIMKDNNLQDTSSLEEMSEKYKHLQSLNRAMDRSQDNFECKWKIPAG